MIDPHRINGAWDEGYYLDLHTKSSIYLGDDDAGTPQFDTVRTELGQLIYQMKYNGHFDTSPAIIALCSQFITSWLKDKKIDVVISVPPSTQRPVQPVFLLSKAVADLLGASLATDGLEKSKGNPSKNMDRANKEIVVSQVRYAIRAYNVLLIDDLMDTGTTANACVNALREDPNICKIYFMAFTKRRK